MYFVSSLHFLSESVWIQCSDWSTVAFCLIFLSQYYTFNFKSVLSAIACVCMDYKAFLHRKRFCKLLMVENHIVLCET